jgi:hypothetical protein
MIQYEDMCVCCDLPCLGDSCPNRNVRVCYCDECGDEVETLYYAPTSNRELCKDCILEELEIVGD